MCDFENELANLKAEICALRDELDALKAEVANEITKRQTLVELAKFEPKERFKKPTIDEINALIVEKNYAVNAEYFFNYYESKGWKIGNSPMKNWRMALANWNVRMLKSQNKKAEKIETLKSQSDFMAKQKDSGGDNWLKRGLLPLKTLIGGGSK